MKFFYPPKIILELFSSFHPDIIPPNSLYFVFFSYDIRLTFPLDNPLQMFPIAVTCGNTFVLKPSEKDPGNHCFLIIPQITLIQTCFFYLLFPFNTVTHTQKQIYIGFISIQFFIYILNSE